MHGPTLGNGWGFWQHVMHGWRTKVPNIGPKLMFQQLMYCFWPNVGPTTMHQRWILCSSPEHACSLL